MHDGMGKEGSGNDKRQTTGPRKAGTMNRYLRARPYLLEVAGAMEDPAVQATVKSLHLLHNRYQPILRTMSTLTASRISEDELFGGTAATASTGLSGGEAGQSETRWIRRPSWAVTGNKSLCIVPRFHPLDTTGNEDARSPAQVLDSFINYRVLPQAITHNFLPVPTVPLPHSALRGDGEVGEEHSTPLSFSPQDVDALLLRHFVHESSRTSSFLVADAETKHAVIIDPLRHSMPLYEPALVELGVKLTHIIVTHCFVDAALCVNELTTRFPTVKVVSGVKCNREANAASGLDASGVVVPKTAGEVEQVALSERLVLRAVALPSFSPESQLVELTLRGTLIALFSGAVWGTDAAPRADLYESFSSLLDPAGAGSPDATTAMLHESGLEHSPKFFSSPDAMRTAQANLKAFFYDRYLFPPTPPLDIPSQPHATAEKVLGHGGYYADAGSQPNNAPNFDAKGRYDRVVLFPSHGGYSNASNQLDLYWAIHLGDLKRMRHARVVVDTLASPEAYVAYAKKLPPLPRPLLFQSNRRFNLRSLVGQAPDALAWRNTASPYPPLIVDTRDAPAYHKLHLRGSVNIPFSFPGAAYGAKRGELWLQCMALPSQPLIAVAAASEDKAEIADRLRSVAPCAHGIAVFTVEELLAPVWTDATVSSASSSGPVDGEAIEALVSAIVATGGSPRLLEKGCTAVANVGNEIHFSTTAPTAAGASLPGNSAPLRLLGDRASKHTDAADAPISLRWVTCAAANRAFDRIDAPEKLAALDVALPTESDGSAVEPAQQVAREEGDDASARPVVARTLVVDVRTDFEFKQGSHQRSVHLQLAELCAMTAEATRKQARTDGTARHGQGKAPSDISGGETRALTAPAPGSLDGKGTHKESLAHFLFGALLENALVSGVLPVGSGLRDVGGIAVYCAGGYRSLIAASLFRRALELAVDGEEDSATDTAKAAASTAPTAFGGPPLTSNSTDTAMANERDKRQEERRRVLQHLARIPILDVAGGAFTIMTHRPDLWMVKDRSIICIS